MTDLPAIRSRLEALADWLTEHVKTLPTETRVWPNKLAGYIDTLRTVLALLAGPGEEEVRELCASLRANAKFDARRQAEKRGSSDPDAKPEAWDTWQAADLIERLAVRLEAEKRTREELRLACIKPVRLSKEEILIGNQCLLCGVKAEYIPSQLPHREDCILRSPR